MNMGTLDNLEIDPAAWDGVRPTRRADLLFTKGCSCSQSVLAGFARHYDLDLKKALELTRTFGSGMGQGYTCGAVIGAFMVIGLGIKPLETERETRYQSYNLVNEFIRRFTERNRAIDCKDLLDGVDLSTDEGRRVAAEKNLFTTVCPKFVTDAADILEDMLELKS